MTDVKKRAPATFVVVKTAAKRTTSVDVPRSSKAARQIAGSVLTQKALPRSSNAVRQIAESVLRQKATVTTVGAKASIVNGKVVVRAADVGAFRGFSHTPEEGKKLARSSFTDTALLRRVKK